MTVFHKITWLGGGQNNTTQTPSRQPFFANLVLTFNVGNAV